MTAFLDGSSATLIFDLEHQDGSPIVGAKSVIYKLLDKDNVQLITQGVINPFVVGATTATITIPGIYNALAVGENSGVRKLSIWVVAGNDNTIQIDKFYVIQGVNHLSFMTNSYQNAQEAELTAFNIPNLTAFTAAANIDKVAALKEAFSRLGMMVYLVSRSGEGTSGTSLSPQNESPSIISGLNLLSLDYINTLPDIFIAKLRVAQVIEANYILNGDAAEDKRGDGIVTEKVGESTTTWRQGRPLRLPVCWQALESLRGYLHYGSRLGRG